MSKPIIFLSSTLLLLTNILFAESIKNIDYVGDGNTQHKLDIYIPSGTGPFPAVMHYPGMAFTNGNSKSDGGLSSSYNSAGFIVVAPNLTGGVVAKYPTQIQELKATVRFLRANAVKYKLDPTFIGVIGFSSGAWNTVILATTGDVKEYKVGSTTMDLEGNLGGNLEFSSRVQAGWAAAAPTQFLSMDSCGSDINHGAANSPEGGLIGGALAQNKDKCTLANPITFVTLDDPPIHLVHGTSDRTVPTCQSVLLINALNASGNKHEMTYTPASGGHMQNYTGSLDFFKKALAANKAGCLDPKNPNFDSLATYCSTGICCTPIVRTVPSALKQHRPIQLIGLDLVNSSTQMVSYTVFDVAGHLLATGRLAPNCSFDLRETGSGLRLCELRGNGKTAHEKVICP